jgi:pyochelin biosynthetic protein PchC
MLQDGDDGRWLRTFHPSPAGSARLLCFPHAGGSASYFAPLSKALAPEIEVVGVQYPGRQDRAREAPVETIEDMTDGSARALEKALPSWDDRPLAFFGHSMGAIVAYEVARRLSRPPEFLFASARRQPSKGFNELVHLLDDAGLVAELRRVAGPDKRWLEHEKLLTGVLPTIRSDYKAIEMYSWTPGPPLDCSITAIVGDEDPYTSVEMARAWTDFCAGDFDLHVLPGGHFYLETNVPAVAEIVSAKLSTAGHDVRRREAAGQ